MPRNRLSLENIDILDETEFEEFCFELMEGLGSLTTPKPIRPPPG